MAAQLWCINTQYDTLTDESREGSFTLLLLYSSTPLRLFQFLDVSAPSVMFPNSLMNKMSLMKINQIFMYNWINCTRAITGGYRPVPKWGPCSGPILRGELTSERLVWAVSPSASDGSVSTCLSLNAPPASQHCYCGRLEPEAGSNYVTLRLIDIP